MTSSRSRWPDPQLRAARQQAEEHLNAVKAAMSGRSPEIQAAEEALRRAGLAIGDELLSRLRAGEWVAWGREGSPVEPYRRLDADAWEYLEIERERSHPWGDATITGIVSYTAPSRRIFFDNLPVAMPGATVRFFSVVVARQAEASKLGAPGYKKTDMPLVHEMRAMILDEPGLRPMAAARRLVDRAEGGGDSEVRARRLRKLYREEFGD